jgi:peroxiredoxin Q/BCP
VLYFYPKDDTPGCACQATEFTETLSQFRNMNAMILGVSADSPQSHRLFIEKYGLALTLLSDPNHAVMKRYGAWVESSLGEKKTERVIRSTFIIGPNGLVRYHFPEVIPQGHAERVREKLAELQRGR